ncbi:MAG: 1-deoxy-D-xylulose-5-phosphate reductoisomerase, partial [Chloroflexi bacterium]|nr:1-deoxy-D-xylulose-5-phosphate reductoisomerase [Chloroflexota bacterium]
MKRLTVLGSSGSIGTQTLDVVRGHRDTFKIVGLSVKADIESLLIQIDEFKPEVVAVADIEAAARLPELHCDILVGDDGAAELAGWDGADIVLNALVGAAGLRSTLNALAAGRTLALANKESMVAGGALVKKAMAGSGATIIPVDSEHSALFQCLIGERKEEAERLILTGSGGPFRGRTLDQLRDVTVDEAL